MTWPETFRAAIAKGVHDIAGGEKLDGPEKRQLLAILRERDDCPKKWTNKAPEKQSSILESLRQAIEKVLNPEEFAEKQQAAIKKYKENGQQKIWDDRKNKRNRENGKQEATIKKYKENGQQKIWSARNNAKRSKALHEANAQAILENKDHHEDTWDEDTLEKEAIDIVKYIVDKCGPDGFVHVFVGAWPGKKLKEAVEAECFGRGRHAVFIDGGRRVHYHHVSDHVKLLIPYTGINCLNADNLEERVHRKLLDMKWPQHRRMFTKAGAGSCKGKRAAGIPFPYYTGVLVCEQSMEQIGIRLATTKDHPPRKRKRSSSSSSSSSSSL
jgi:hypothetical protein